MKKTLYILFAAAIAIATVACSKEELFNSDSKQPQMRTFTCALDQGDVTKTNLTEKGKTVWEAGDKIWVSNGTAFDTLTVTPHADAPQYCDFKTALQGTLYVVYPFSAAKGVADGKFDIEVPTVQNGAFGSANIAVAIATDTKVKMKNVTSVLQFRIPGNAKPIKAVSVNAVDNVVAGDCTVDMTSGSPVVTANDTYSDVIVKTDGLSGKFYMSVIPGTYNAGFSLTAVSTDLKNASQTKTTVAAKTLNANELFDLGTIGDNLQPLQGDGSSASPWLISSLPEMLAFTYYVNEGNSMKGQFVKVTKDIKGITIPVGVYDDQNKSYIPFKGSFDGGEKTLTVSIEQDGKHTGGLFANLGDSASVSNVVVAGKVSSDLAAGALAGYVGSSSKLKISNCKSTAKVSGKNNVGGLIGLTKNYDKANVTSIEIDNCSNESSIESDGVNHGGLVGSSSSTIYTKCSNTGSVNGKYNVGGIAGYSYVSYFTDCKNTSNITATETAGLFFGIVNKQYVADYKGGAAGVAGYAQTSFFKRCTNSGAISGVNKSGGIAGTLYWGNMILCENSGSVDVSEDAAGGIVGWNITQGKIYGCTNKGDITTKRYQAGGIAGQVQPFHSGNSTLAFMYYQKCTNEGKITVTDGNSAGGIVGYTWIMNNGIKLTIDGCINTSNAVISAPQYAGGICGSEGRYSNWSRFDILNCENHGYVYGKSIIGGIFGGMISYTKSQGTLIYNCYNTGNVEYADSSSTAPYAGGIAGFINNGANNFIQNDYNSGLVRPQKGAPVAGARIGAILGFHNNAVSVYDQYFLEGSCAQAFGPGSKGTFSNISMVKQDFTLETPVTIGTSTFITLVEALNGWSTNSAYYKWAAGPVFVYPSYSDPIDGGGFDLVNGGQL